MQMSVKERLIEFLRSQGISQRTFEQTIGVSNGYVNTIRMSIQPDKVRRIAQNFPSLNTGWLLTGEGAMLKDDVEMIEPSPDNEFPDAVLKAISAVEKIANSNQILSESNRILAESTHELTLTNKILATSNTDLVQKFAGLLDELRELKESPERNYPSLDNLPLRVASDVDPHYDETKERG